MQVFQSLLALLACAIVLSAFARRLGVPYPTLLALGGTLLAVVPSGPRLELPPDLILALFVAPILLDAAYGASLRDLRRDWAAVSSLVLVAVALTTLAVAFAARLILPDIPFAAAVALGALLAPPDAVAALAVLRQIDPPHRIRVVLEGESLLNDASSLLVYRLAVAAVAAGSFGAADALPAFLLVFFGSLAAGWLLARPVSWLTARIEDAPSSVIFQFVSTFGVWLLAEDLGLSGVVTIVVLGLTLARQASAPTPAALRVPSFAIWETATVVLNVLAFTLIGLELRPILEALTPAERVRYIGAALLILAVVILVRMAWSLAHHWLAGLWRRRRRRGRGEPPPEGPGMRDALVIGWSGMRGIVTLAASLALPADFPYRDFIQLTAFVVVLGTLALQGLTLKPLLRALRFPKDTTVETELHLARELALKAALGAIDGEASPAARRIGEEYAEALGLARDGTSPRERPDNLLRRRIVEASRRAIDELRDTGRIGDAAYRRAEEELDWLELSVRSAEGGP